MAMPPSAPLKVGEDNMTYFQYLAILARPIIEKEDPNVRLVFTGYFDTVEEYKDLGIMEWKKALKLSKEINAWTEYFSEISNLVQKVFLDIDLKYNEKQAIISISHDPQYVTNGNRLAYQDMELIRMERERNVVKSLNDELRTKVRFLERAFYHCKSIGEAGQKSGY